MVSTKSLPNFIAFGNCLVDQSVVLCDDRILKQNKLDSNSLGECSTKILENIIKDIKHENLKINVHLGGSALNTCRILNRLGGQRILFCGSIGDDENGQFVTDELKKLAIDSLLQTSKATSTGTCVCLIHNQNRCCYANIGASRDFSADNLQNQLNFLKNLKEKVVIYVEGFFLPERSHVVRHIFEQISLFNSSVTFAVNISANYIIENYTKDINYLVDKCDIVFGNRDEFETLAKCNFKSSVIELIYLLNENLAKNEKFIIVTNGNQPIEIYTLIRNESFKWETLDVRFIATKEIKDTTGAGDAFVAGFVFEYLQQKPIKDCVNNGMEVAVRKLSNIGAHL